MTAQPQGFLPGIDVLVQRHSHWIRGQRVGLVSHPAALDSRGNASVERLAYTRGITLTALFGPEHGYFGHATAGEGVAPRRHPTLGVPVHSLYGATRKPTAQMLKRVDVLVVDLQDLGVRCYTYISTLRLVLESAAEQRIPVIVADRPIPLPNTVDGPMLEPTFAGFVALVPFPMVYGMTLAEAALALRETTIPTLDLRIAPMQGYTRQPVRGVDWPPWIPPSQGIPTWETGMCYGTTVLAEALPAVDHGRGTGLPFQLIGAPWLKGEVLSGELNRRRMRGIRFVPHPYYPATGQHRGKLVNGMRLVLTDPDGFRPVTTAMHIFEAIQRIHGTNRLWRSRGTRPAFFDALCGTDATRNALRDGTPPPTIARGWRSSSAAFLRLRTRCLIYPGATQ